MPCCRRPRSAIADLPASQCAGTTRCGRSSGGCGRGDARRNWRRRGRGRPGAALTVLSPAELCCHGGIGARRCGWRGWRPSRVAAVWTAQQPCDCRNGGRCCCGMRRSGSCCWHRLWGAIGDRRGCGIASGSGGTGLADSAACRCKVGSTNGSRRYISVGSAPRSACVVTWRPRC